MEYKRLELLPVAVCILILGTFIITYTIAVLLEHVEPGFPYISYTGNVSPESCIFGQLLNVATVLLLLCVYLRYRQLSAVETSSKLNKISAAFGVLSCIGMNVVANFQEGNVIFVHLAGAGLCFASGTCFFFMQTILTLRTGTRKLLIIRALLSGICVITCLTTIVPGMIAMVMYDGDNRMKWLPTNKGFTYYLVSSVSEWVLSIAFCLFVLSFYSDLKMVRVNPPRVAVK